MNNTIGIKKVFGQKGAMTVLARSLDITKPKVMFEVVQVSYLSYDRFIVLPNILFNFYYLNYFLRALQQLNIFNDIITRI